jgi:rare lipoprotein A (peptidoglycan hydrolase)
VVVDVLARGPFVRGRDLDISTAAARQLGIYEQEVAKVEVPLLPPQEVPDTFTLNTAEHYCSTVQR